MRLFEKVDADRRIIDVNIRTGLDEMPKNGFRGGLLKAWQGLGHESIERMSDNGHREIQIDLDHN